MTLRELSELLCAVAALDEAVTDEQHRTRPDQVYQAYEVEQKVRDLISLLMEHNDHNRTEKVSYE